MSQSPSCRNRLRVTGQRRISRRSGSTALDDCVSGIAAANVPHPVDDTKRGRFLDNNPTQPSNARMSKALILQHVAYEGPGRIEPVFRDFGIPTEVRHLYRGDEVPTDLDSVRVLIVL